MSLLSLPTELLQQILSNIPSHFRGDLSDRSSWTNGPLIELDPTLRTLCATNRHLRSILLPSLYDTVGIVLPRSGLWSECSRVVVLFDRTGSSILRLIRLVGALCMCWHISKICSICVHLQTYHPLATTTGAAAMDQRANGASFWW